MHSYLKNRKQRVQINSIFSAPKTVTARVPSVAIDETLLSNSLMKFGIITNWFYKNFMAINSEKCHFMCIGRNRENETFTFKDAVIKTARKKLFLGELLIINWILIVT